MADFRSASVSPPGAGGGAAAWTNAGIAITGDASAAAPKRKAARLVSFIKKTSEGASKLKCFIAANFGGVGVTRAHFRTAQNLKLAPLTSKRPPDLSCRKFAQFELKPRDKTVNLRLPEQLLDAVRKRAKRAGVAVSTVYSDGTGGGCEKVEVSLPDRSQPSQLIPSQLF